MEMEILPCFNRFIKKYKKKKENFQMNCSKLFFKTQEQIERFAKPYLEGLPAKYRRTTIEMIYGILHSGEVMLSEIARSLNEDISLTKTICRLSTNMRSEAYDEEIEDRHLSLLKPKIKKDTLIVMDGSDITKPRSRKMEGLCLVRDASKNKIGMGYYLHYCCIVNENRDKILPLTTRLFSTKEEDFKSVQDEKEKLQLKLSEYFNNKGIWIMDREYSDYATLVRFSGFKRRFVIRARDRNIIYKGKKQKLYAWSKRIKNDYAMVVETIDKNGNKNKYDTFYTIREIEINELKMYAVILKMGRGEPVILLTNQKPNSKKLAFFGETIISQYGVRWSVEEKIRFEKQLFKYENVRLQSLKGLKNLMSIINIISFFMERISPTKLGGYLIKKAKPIKQKVRLKYYRLAMGIRCIFRKRSKQVFSFTDYRYYFPDEPQMNFW